MGLATVAAPGATALHPSASATPYRDGPPSGFSGGFGEQSCHACHFMENVDDGVGRVLITGVPERYQPNESYLVTVTVTRPGVAVAGFQLTARFEGAGAQAGALAFPEDGATRGRVALREGVQYAQHLRPGTSLVAPDTARWTVLWTAPREGGPVLLHVAANAGDDDDSVHGDFIYTAVAASQGSP